MSIMDKLKSNSKIKETQILSESKFFTEADMVPTDVPMINVALSGSMQGGLAPGLTVLAGPSKHFKTSFALIMASAYLKKYDDAVCLLYDTEFGITPEYLESMNVDPQRCIHTPIEHVEQLKFDITKQLEEIEKGDKVIIVIDSVGNLASKKELDDALDGKSVADMSRAKALKSLFRICTPYLTTRDIPLVAVNHTYKEIGMFPKDIMSGGTGIYYSANQILFMGRQQEKDGTEVIGNIVHCKNHKSRMTIENKMVDVRLTYDKGLDRYYGLLDLALKYDIFKSVSTRIELPDGSKTFGKTINNNPEKYFTEDIMKQLDECAEKEFKYGNIEEIQVRPE